MSDRPILFNQDGQKEMKEFLLRVKNNLADGGEQDREYSRPSFTEELKTQKNNITVEFDENPEFANTIT